MEMLDIGKRIAQLRKSKDMTQAQLAQRLDVSDRAVSKWENGSGLPDITVFPRLASVFGVSIDYLMLGSRTGIAIAGNIIADVVKNIQEFPKLGMLSQISEVLPAVGGCVPNTAIDLAKIDGSIPIRVAGRIGSDENGHFILSKMQKMGIDTQNVSVSKTSATSFSDVMSMPTGERTFFHKKGANEEFSPEDIDLATLNCSMLHIGYILLLDQFDAPDPTYGTRMAAFLHKAQQLGIKTSIDVVSDSSADYGKTIIPALKYCDYVIINEIECSGIWQMDPIRPDGSVDAQILRQAMEKTAQAGVKSKVIVHCKQYGLILDVPTGSFTQVASLKIPPELIKGSVGAGDAYCAGCLYGLYNHYTDRQILEFASISAASSLFAANSVDGMRSLDELMAMATQFERLPL